MQGQADQGGDLAGCKFIGAFLSGFLFTSWVSEIYRSSDQCNIFDMCMTVNLASGNCRSATLQVNLEIVTDSSFHYVNVIGCLATLK